MIDISSGGKCLRRLDLDHWSEGLAGSFPVNSSPDLALINYGSKVFHVSNEIDDLASKPFYLPLSPEWKAQIEIEHFDLQVMLDYRSEYLAFFGELSLPLFRLDLTRRLIDKVEIDVPIKLSNVSVAFYPSLQWMLLSYKNQELTTFRNVRISSLFLR